MTRKRRRRFITRGEAVDIPHYDRPEDIPAPGDSQSGQTPVNTTPPTPPSSRQPPHTPPSGKTRRRIERSPGSLSPSAASSTRRRFSPGGSPSALSRASTLSTPPQHSGQTDMNRYGSYVKDTATGGSTGMGLARSVTTEAPSAYKPYSSYLDSRLAELDPTRSTSHRSSRRDSSSSESSIHGSVASLHSDGSLRESTPSYHDSLLTPPRSPTDKQRSRSNASRPRSWYDAPQLQSHISSESPTGFPFAASSYENLDKEGSADSVLPRSSTIASIGAPKKENLSHLAHARSFAGHEGRESLSPKPAAGSSPFMVAKHFPGGKASSWQPPGSRAADPAAGRTKYASDTNVRKYGQESAALPNHCARESPYPRAASGESDSSSLVSVASVPAGGATRPFRTDSHTRDSLTRDRSFDSAISEPVCLRTQPAAPEGGEFVQYGPCKARPFGNRSHTVDLLQVQPKGPPPSQATQANAGQRQAPVKASVKEQAKKFACRPEVVCPPCGVPVMPTAGRPDGGPYPVGSYKSATMPVKLFEGYDKDRRPSLPEQAERRVLYKEQRLKELSALPSFGSSLPKRSQSIDVTAKKATLSRSEAPSMAPEGMLPPSASARADVLMSSKPAVIPEGGCRAPPSSKSVLSVHKPSVLPTVTETSFSSSPPQAKDSVPQATSAKHTQECARAPSVNEPSPTQSLVTPLCSSPELKSTDVGQLSSELSTKTITVDSDQSAFKPFVKTREASPSSSASVPSVAGVAVGLAVTEVSVTTCASPLLKVKSPSQTSATSTSSRGSTSASPRLSPRPLELWAVKETSPMRTYYDPADEQTSKPEVQRGISQESIQSAMAVLDDAIAMLNSVAKNTGTTPTSSTTTTTTETSLTSGPTTSTTSPSCCTGIDLSRSGLLKYSSQAIGAKPLVTSHYASMPLPVSASSAGSASPIGGPPTSAPSTELFKAVTQLASTVKTVMSNTQAPSTEAAVPTIISTSLSEKTTATGGEPIVRPGLPGDNNAKGSKLQDDESREEHGPSVTGHRPTDTSPLDQILASIEREESLLCASALPPEHSKPEEEPRAERKADRRQTFSDRPRDREKSLEELEARRRTLIRDDSFNRSDSDPDVGCMPLPRDSVILRHRYHIKEDMSSSSDSSSPATPRLSPRVIRRHKKPGSDSSAVGDGKRRKHLNIPGKHRSGKDLVGGDRPLVSSDGQPISHPAVGLATAYGSHPRDTSSTTTGSYYSVPPASSSSSSSAAAAAASSSSSSSSSPAVVASSEVTWSTPPSTPQTLRLAAGCRHQGSPSSEPPPRSSSSAVRQRLPSDQTTAHEQGIYNVHSAQTAVLGGRPGSAGLHSDSSSVSSHRRRFRVRDQETPPEQNAPSLTVRPGKKDKSLQRKSVLNLPGPDGLDHRQRDSDPSSSSPGAQNRAATLPSGRQPYLTSTTTSTPTRHGPKGSLFSLGKTSKKEAKPSALGALISQTAILAPAVAQSHAASDSKPVSPPCAGKEALSMRPTEMDSLHAAEVQSPPTADTKTKERRGLGIWSSGESVTDQVSVLTPITEEQKVEKGDSRLELTDNSGEEEEKVSVAQRIFQMENKLDEDRFTLTRPTSGFTTPRLKVIRPKGSPLKGAYTPHAQAIQPTSPLATDERQLLDKLTKVADIAMVRDAAAERRKRFMQRHCGDRRRTQPVTLEEIREADSLESVSSFRAEVLRKSSLNIFGQDSEGPKEPVFIKKVKGQEVFPQHIKHERLKERHKDVVRFKTLPVTQTELNEIPESEALTIVHTQSSVKTLRQKLEEIEKMDSTEDILDGKAESKLIKSTDMPGDKQKSVSKPQVSGDIPQKESSPRDDKGTSSSKKMQVDQVTSSLTTSSAATSLVTSHHQIPPQNIEISDDELDQLVEINYKQLSSHKKKQQQESQLKKQLSASQQQDQSKSANQNVAETTVHSSQPQGKSVFQESKSVKSKQSKTVPKLASDINKATAANGEALSQREKQQSANVIEQAGAVKPQQQGSEISDISCEAQHDTGIMDREAGREVGVSTQKTSAVKDEKQSLTVLSTSVTHPESITEKKSKSPPATVESETSTVIITEVQSAIKVSAANQKSPSKQPPTEIQTSEKEGLSDVKSNQVRGGLKKEESQGQSGQVGEGLSDSSQMIEGATGQEVSTTDTDTTEDELSKLSVSEKLQLFKKLDKTARLSADSEAKQRRKFLERRKKLARSQTLPVTGEDVSGIKDEERKEITKSVTNLNQAVDSVSDTSTPLDSGQCVRRGSGLISVQEQTQNEEEKEDDPLSKLSLAEKVRLFSEKKEEGPQKREAAIIRRKNRRLQSRFKTQSTEEPVTSDEVEKARISPLVMSLVKPPDPEILQSMSIKDQREFVAQWAEATLSDSGSRSGSQSGSRPSSVALDETKLEDDAPKATLEEDNGVDDKKRKGILKTSESHTPEVRGILKHSPPTSDREVRSILKADGATSDGESDRKPASILKHDVSHHDPEAAEHPSILKKDSPQHEAKPETHGILKRDGVQVKKEAAGESTHSILKKDSLPYEVQHEIRGILKKESSESKTEPEKSVLKKRDSSGSTGELGLESAETEVFVKKDARSDSMTSTDDGLSARRTDLLPERGVLKKTSSLEIHTEPRQRSVLKKESSFESSKEVELKSALKITSSARSEAVQQGKPSLITRSEAKKATVAQEEEVLAVVTEPVRSRGQVTPAEDENKNKTSGSGLSRSHSAHVHGRRDSSTDDDTVTSSEKKSWIKNDAVARRRLRKTEERKVNKLKLPSIFQGGSTNRHSMTAELEQKLLSRSDSGKDENEDEEKHPGHKSLEKSNSSPERTMTKVSADPVVVKLRDGKCSKQRPHSIADRLSMLKNSQEGWKTKVEEKDVTKFTVEGKLNLAGLSPKPDSPFVAKTRLPGTPGKFPLKRESPETSPNITNGTESPFLCTQSLRIPRSTPAPHKPEPLRTQLSSSPLVSPTHSAPSTASPKSSPNLLTKLSDSSDESDSDAQHPNRIKVLRPDDEGFKDFFKNTATERLSEEKVDVSVNDFDHLFTEASDILPTVKKIRPQRRLAGSRNPLKKLAQRDDLQEEYEEVKTGVAERELRRIKREQIAGTVHIAQEALAGLASKENFSQVSLRKTDSFGSSTPGSSYLPYKDVMLIQVKGRRHCQMRLVAPEAHSINSGDCFLLVTADSIFIWQGEFSNVIERNRASELASTIYQKRDLGCKTNHEPVLVTESKQKLSSSGERFWQILGGFGEYQAPGPVEEDELYEMYMAETTKIYGLKGDELIALDSGYLPTYDLLNSKKVLVFDFGSEMYTWLGKHVSFNDRKKAVRLAKAIWDKGYDYEDCNINPLNPLSVEENGGLPMKSEKRPDWALFGKVTEQMETILFKEKFIDWPNAAKLIKVKGHDEEQDKEETAELVPYDVSKMLPLDTTPITMVLEGSNVGRGKVWSETVDGIQREFEILTLGVEIFHILEYDHLKLDPASLGQFHDSDTYVIRWHLMISQTGLRNIRTQEMRHSQTGRERWAYFFWQGQYSTITEKGASALMTVELDEERGPQVRVTQGKEPPCFLQLFKGRMIVHKGKREDESTNTSGPWRLYIVRGELPNECYLQEVPCKMSSLRSRTSMILLNVKTGILHVWHGSKSPSHTRQRAVDIGKSLEKSCPAEVGLHDNVEVIMCEVSEGSEKSDFLAAMDTRERTYNCLMKDPTPQRHSARLFYMHSVCGEFVATEILNPSRNHDNLCTPFPFNQEELYKASQPALFLFDNHYEVFLWQGWWPEQTEEGDNVITGSAQSRFNVNRRLAIETALNYCKEKNSESPPKAWLVYAGLEPTKFTNLFPVWEVNEEARASNLKEDKSDGEMTSLEKLLKKLTCTQYTFSELQVRPLPEGVDPMKIESYLVDSEFQEIVKMTKEEFYALPAWKQNNIKKEVGLF